MISLFLGAGFSAPAGVPLASQIFDSKPSVDRITRERLVNRVTANWQLWTESTGGSAEEYLADLQKNHMRAWIDAQWYVSLVIAMAMGQLQIVGTKMQVTKHNINRTTGVKSIEDFFTILFRRTEDVSVITTNYDILLERALRHKSRPRVPRPGFHYGWGPEKLEGGGYPSYAHIQAIRAEGTVPIYKLHGSVSWSYRNGNIIHYHDCRPAIRGDAAIIAPVKEKSLPAYFQPIWDNAQVALSNSQMWIVVGYSLPEYDQLVRNLLVESASECPRIHIFDPDEAVAALYKALLPKCEIRIHPGLPKGTDQLDGILAQQLNSI